MIKKTFILFFLLLLVAYLAVAFTRLNSKPADAVCRDVIFNIASVEKSEFITAAELKKELQKGGLYPKDKKISQINCRKIEEYLMKNPFIKNAECYTSPTHKLCVDITQRIPVVRIMGSNGENFYMDEQGEIMPCGSYAVHLPVVTGNITRKNAGYMLKELNACLLNDAFWNSQIEQIHVTPSQELEIVPRVGDHIVFLGKPKDIADKLEKLKAFYIRALNKVGWNKYSRINLEFSNQIICTKKEK